MKYVLGIDFGGGASKATLLCEDGTIAATATAEYPTHYPRSGWTEQDPCDWYRATRDNVRSALETSGIDPADIQCLSLDAATHTAVLMDEDFQVLCPAIYWTDIRSTEEVRELKENCETHQWILSQVCHEADTIWTLPQLMWVRRHRPDIFSRVRRILFAKDYVRHCLTGDYVTDAIEAEGSMLFDFGRQCWSPQLCGVAGLDPAMMPKVVNPTDVVGSLTPQAAEELGLRPGTPVLCGSTDTVMEVMAAGAVKQGQMTLKLATAGRICVITDKVWPHRDLINYSHVVPGLWYPGTATKSCAASLRWYRDTFGGDYRELDAGAETIAPGSEGLLFSPYLNGELTPYADPLLRGSFVGVRSGHTKAHFTRAVLEGVAYSLRDCMEAVERIGIPHEKTATVIGGGSKSPLWRQIVSDVLGITLTENQCSDSSFGSAMLAGVAAGFWHSPEQALAACSRQKSVTYPDEARHELYSRCFETYRRVHDALAPLYHENNE